MQIGGQAAVTVVVPTRNRRDVLEEAVRSVRAQTVPVEIVVVDDASDDGTAAWLVEQDDVTVVRHVEQRRPAAGRNEGARRGTAEWLAFLDDDDLWSPGKLEAQLDALADHPSARWSATGAVWIDRTRRLVGARAMPDRHDTTSEMRALLGEQNHVPGGSSGVVVARSLFEEVGGFAEDLEGAEDWELWVRLAGRSPVAYVDRPLVGYRRWSDNRSTDPARAARAHAEVRRRHDLADPAAVRVERRIFAQRRGREAIGDGHRVGAAAAYAQAAVLGGGASQLAYAMGALVSPRRVNARLKDVDRADIPGRWQDEARGWLSAV